MKIANTTINWQVVIRMYHVAVCDDDKIVGAYIERILLEYSRKEGIELEVDVFFNGETLRETILKGMYYDLIFLDIEMEKGTGIMVGKFLRDILHNEVTHIIYISAYPQYALELFKVRPLDFLIKPFEALEILKGLEKSIELTNLKKQVFAYKKEWDTYKVLIRDILYFESHNKEIEIHTINGIDRFYSSLKKVYEQLKNKYFFYCHQSILINYSQVSEFKYDQLTLKNGEVIMISQGKRKEVRAIVKEFEKENF